MSQRKLIDDAKDLLLNMLPRAGQMVRSFFHAEDLPSYKKGVLDIVTKADLELDAYIQRKLSKAFPDIPILTEETFKGDFDDFKNLPLLWVVDPLDGTANFSRGDVNFSISVALVAKGEPIVGSIFAPVPSRLFWATRDDSYAYWNGRRIHVSNVTEIDHAVVCTDWSHVLDTRDQTTRFLRSVYGRVRQVKILGSAATDITLLARGGVDIYHHVWLYPWDVAAAGLIASKAGATVTEIDGKPWNAFSKSVLAANPVLHAEILKFTV